jgi:hypothetical protein
MTLGMEKDIEQAQQDIKTLVVNVTRLSVMMENSEKRHDEDMKLISEAVRGINGLQQKVASTLNLDKDIVMINEKLGEIKGDVRTTRHDLNTALNALQALPIMQKLIAEQGIKIETLETWRDEIKGASSAVGTIMKGAWAVFGAGALALGYALLKLFFGGSGENNGGY